jgi:histidine phosphotransfer protein HptB
MTEPGGPPTDAPGGHAAGRIATLDEAALAKLRELDPDGRRGVVQRVLAAFESSLLRWIGQLEGGPDLVDASTLGYIAHTLKSSAGSVGAKDLAQACADLERRLRAGETVDLPSEARRLVLLGGAALGAIRAMLHV